MLLAPQSLLPDRGRISSEYGGSSDQTGYFTEVTIPSDSELVGSFIEK